MGGMQRVSMQLSQQLTLNDDVQLVEITQETGWKNIGVKTTFFLLRLLFRLPAFVRKEKPDLILFSSLVTGCMGYFLRKRISIPMVSISHGHDVTLKVGAYQWLLRRMLQNLDAVISVSTATQKECLSRGLAEHKSVVLPNGFDMQDLQTPYSKKQARQLLEKEFGLRLGNRPLLLTVGRLIKRKGHRWFIDEVLPRVQTEAVYMVIGDGAEKAAIMQSVSKSDKKANIVLTGRQPDEILEMAYTAADLFIMPNVKVDGDMEGFGVVLLEANLRKTPAIASNIEGIRDVISQGRNGYRIKAGDAAGFAKKIDDVLLTELETLSQESRFYVKHQFSWEKVAKEYIKFLGGLVLPPPK